MLRTHGNLAHNLCDRSVPSVINSVGKRSASLRPRKLTMSLQHRFISADQFHPDPYIQSRNAERTLNAAILHADISRGYEDYLDIFDEFMPTISREAAKPWTNRFAERRECAHFFSASSLLFMRWPRSVVCRYPFEKRRFLEMPSTRLIPRGYWS